MGDLHSLGIRRFYSNEEVDVAVREWLRMQKKKVLFLPRRTFWTRAKDGNGSLCSGIVLQNDDSTLQ